MQQPAELKTTTGKGYQRRPQQRWNDDLNRQRCKIIGWPNIKYIRKTNGSLYPVIGRARLKNKTIICQAKNKKAHVRRKR